MSKMILGPTFEEMLHPDQIAPEVRERALDLKTRDPLDPVNLFNISWRDGNGVIYYCVLPKQLTGVDANIVALYGKDFPTGSHKVGTAYSVLVEQELSGAVDPSVHTIVWPSTGNYGIGGAWVGCRMGFDSVVVLPAGMSAERFERIESYGARVIKTVGSESNVKEIYDKTHELARDPQVRILNQFSALGNYRFHYFVTGNTIADLVEKLRLEIRDLRLAAFCSAMGSAGTIAAGDRLKQIWPHCKIVGLEPIQCPTLFNNGYGSHDIQGIGDKHVPWIMHTANLDCLMCIDDSECKKGLQLLTEEAGMEALGKRFGVPADDVEQMSQIFGISGVCNVLGAIKTAKFYGMGQNDLIVTVLTDAIDRYHSVMADMTRTFGAMDEVEATVRLVSIFHKQKTDWIKEGTQDTRRRWHNLKYFTWVEQQGKSVEELDAQLSEDWWQMHQAMVAETDTSIEAARKYQ